MHSDHTSHLFCSSAANANYKPEEAEPPFIPCFFFFYGSLMDPEVLQAVLGLPEVPVVKEGWVIGFATKMWGIYPALLPCEGEKVFGTVWKVNAQSHFLRLMEYETFAYTWCSCDVECNGETCVIVEPSAGPEIPVAKNLEKGNLIYDITKSASNPLLSAKVRLEDFRITYVGGNRVIDAPTIPDHHLLGESCPFKRSIPGEC
jgi:hypothetical protein